MLDYDIIKVFRPIILSGLAEVGISAEVLMNYQPTKQGITDNTVYFFPIGDKNVGSLTRQNVIVNGSLKSVEVQVKETTFQINGVMRQNPNVLTITAKDLVSYVHIILQRRETIKTLSDNGLGILWVGNIRNIPFQNGAENWEYDPSFDFTITHNMTISGELPKIDNFNYNKQIV